MFGFIALFALFGLSLPCLDYFLRCLVYFGFLPFWDLGFKYLHYLSILGLFVLFCTDLGNLALAAQLKPFWTMPNILGLFDYFCNLPW